jgi:hypothetical protein
MLKLTKKNNGNYDKPNTTFIITDANTEASFQISYLDNGDLYWQNNSKIEKETFVIKREYLVLYHIFKQLFIDLDTNRLFKQDKEEWFYDEEREKLYLKSLNDLKKLLYQQKEKQIKFKSCDLVDLNSSEKKFNYFEIKAKDKCFVLTFHNLGERKATIRINTNRCEYGNLVILFIEFYKRLNKYYDEYQITMDDYLEVIKPLEQPKEDINVLQLRC